MQSEFEKTFKQHRDALTTYLTNLGKQRQVQAAEWDIEQNKSDYEFYFNAGWQAAKANAIPDGFVVVPKQPTPKMIDATWNFDEEIQDMSHNSRNEFIYNAMIAAAQEQKKNKAPELVNNDVTYVIELQGCEAIEHARVTLKKKGYKTWDYTDKDSIDDADIYVLCVCPSTPNDSALVKGTFKGIHQGRFTYIQTDLESCPDAQGSGND